MDDITKKIKEAEEAFNILSTQLGDDDIYKRILLEVIFEKLMIKKGGEFGK